MHDSQWCNLIGTLGTKHGIMTTSKVRPSSSGGPRGGQQVVGSTPYLASGPCSYPLFPGHCTPVLLLLFPEDFAETMAQMQGHHGGSGGSRSDAPGADALGSYVAAGISASLFSASLEDRLQMLLAQRGLGQQKLNGSMGLGGLSGGMSGVPVPEVKVLASATRLAAPLSVVSRKKLLSSLDAQARFLLKKTRAGMDIAGTGVGGLVSSRSGGLGLGASGPGAAGTGTSTAGGIGSGGVGGGGVLFTLDPSRAVLLIDRTASRRLGALDDVIDLLRTGQFSLMKTWEKGVEEGNASGEDVQATWDFIQKQVDSLRGKGGGGGASTGSVSSLTSSNNKTTSAATESQGQSLQLPTLKTWIQMCQVLSASLVEAATKEDELIYTEAVKDVLRSKVGATSQGKRRTAMGKASPSGPELGLTWLPTESELDLRFSAMRCKQLLPSAMEVYLQGLPARYPTRIHLERVSMAKSAFLAMGRGVAVPSFLRDLEEECEKVWRSGRRRCDAVSLTGHPCMHGVHAAIGSRRNGVQQEGADEETKWDEKKHCSGVVFLHACACGRSRRLREDPFDYASANSEFYEFKGCEGKLQVANLPSRRRSPDGRGGGGAGGGGGECWGLVRLGSANYYSPATGVLQPGFVPDGNFLSPWRIMISPQVEDSGTESADVRGEGFPEQGRIDGQGFGIVSQVLKSGFKLHDNQVELRGANKVREEAPKVKKVKEKGLPDGPWPRVGESGVLAMGSEQVRKGVSNAKVLKLGRQAAVASAAAGAREGIEDDDVTGFPPLPLAKGQTVRSKGLQEAIGGKAAGGRKRTKGVENVDSAGKVKADRERVWEEVEAKLQENSSECAELVAGKVMGTGDQAGLSGFWCTAFIGFEYECPRGHRYFARFQRLQEKVQPELMGGQGGTPVSTFSPNSPHIQSRHQYQHHAQNPNQHQHQHHLQHQGSPSNQGGGGPMEPVSAGGAGAANHHYAQHHVGVKFGRQEEDHGAGPAMAERKGGQSSSRAGALPSVPMAMGARAARPATAGRGLAGTTSASGCLGQPSVTAGPARNHPGHGISGWPHVDLIGLRNENIPDSTDNGYIEANRDQSARISRGVNIHRDAESLPSADLPLYRVCSYCKAAGNETKGAARDGLEGGTLQLEQGEEWGEGVSQLQRIFVVTPPHPLLLGSNPLVEFREIEKCAGKSLEMMAAPHVQNQPVSTPYAQQQQQQQGLPMLAQQFQPLRYRTHDFGIGCEVLLPPDSFLCLRLPFIYSVGAANDIQRPLMYWPEKPEVSGRVVAGTVLYVAGGRRSGENGVVEGAVKGGGGS
ncbi:hypothetical protein CBR_g8254 [Chara braunii]|uniref:Nonsense-mediated mRNA decay factor SMG8 n=1 Tax=Chara braunii TaxID=69332 RepID=A0A388KLM3_CHABU|nr:hypothetical protein CBR_g8254 [Chara braunii]|eukprot:GBG70954.1 hypothetical protein CBR_g8254 [Chara braunii]